MPASRRCSSRLVWIGDVGRPSPPRIASIVRTLWPISRPMSQSVPKKRSIDGAPARRRASRQQDQHVDVGMREELRRGRSRRRRRSASVGGIARLAPDAAQRRGRPGARARAAAAACRAARGTRRAARRGRRCSSSRQCARRASAGARRRAAAAARTPSRRRVRPRRGGGGAPAETRQHLEAVVGDEHRVLPLRRQRVVGGDDGPAVGERSGCRACRR